jgi:replication factor C subunit 2/4
MGVLWTEKYRPRDIESFECPEHIKEFLKKSADGSFPHLLLYGPPGTGKTTFSHLLSRENFLELNASDDRGIGVVRDKVKVYASGISSNKVIILDECDNLTTDAQQCLRRVIEDFSESTRFIFIANYLSKIIGPLKSRLLKIRFECKKENSEYLKRVGSKEGINVSDKFYDDLFEYCKYDLRRALNMLQGMHPFVREGMDFIGNVPQDIINEFLRINEDEISEFVRRFVKEGYSFLQFLQQMNETLACDEKKRAEFYTILSLFEERAVIGCSCELMMYSLCCKKIEILK